MSEVVKFNVPMVSPDLSNLESLLRSYEHIKIVALKYALQDDPNPDQVVSNLAYERTILEMLQGEMSCCVNEIGKRLRYLDIRLAQDE